MVFSRRTDAVAAVKRYNNVQLDGKPMKIEIVGTNMATRAVAPAANGNFGNSNGVSRGYAFKIRKICFSNVFKFLIWVLYPWGIEFSCVNLILLSGLHM